MSRNKSRTTSASANALMVRGRVRRGRARWSTQSRPTRVALREHSFAHFRHSAILRSVMSGALPQTRRTARDIVADYLRGEILSGRFPPGQKLNVAEFATLLGVSHTPTREAFQLLASERLVTMSAYRGSTVAELAPDEYEEIFLMRVGLEGLAARLGAERISNEDIERARARVRELGEAAAAGDVGRFLEVNRAFHRIHYLASGRESLWDRILSLRSAAERYTRLGYALPGSDLKETAKRHRVLMRAVEQRDGKAAEREIVSDLSKTFKIVHTWLLQDEAGAARGAASQ